MFSDSSFRDLLNALPAAIYTTDAEGRITFYNEAAVAFSGRRPEVGTDQWCVTWRLYNTDGTALPHDQCPMAVSLKEGRAIRGVEAIAERPDGSRVPFMPFPTPLRDADGNVVGAVNMLIDISERKRAEEQQRTLIDELNHRVKNTLATVQSIAAQTFRSTPDPATFAPKFEGRLVALSRAHDLLTQRRWTGVTLEELIEAELTPFTGDGSAAFTLAGTDVVVSPRVALVLGMVVHELATNALRHGAWSAAGGGIALAWHVETGVTGERFLHLGWRETGGPVVSEPSRRGFGLRIIERSIERDLGGTVELRFDDAGLACDVTAPLL
jgi:PAS domain S-box-containing protein